MSNTTPHGTPSDRSPSDHWDTVQPHTVLAWAQQHTAPYQLEEITDAFSEIYRSRASSSSHEQHGDLDEEVLRDTIAELMTRGYIPLWL